MRKRKEVEQATSYKTKGQRNKIEAHMKKYNTAKPNQSISWDQNAHFGNGF